MKVRLSIGLLALVLIAMIIWGFVSDAGTSDTLPDVSWLRFEQAILDGQWVAHWSFTYPLDVDLRSEGSFVLSNDTEFICEGIDQDTECNCRCGWQHDDGWCGCYFPLPGQFRRYAEGEARCIVQLHWRQNNGFRTWLKFLSVPCPLQNPVYLPSIQKGEDNG